MQMNYIKDSRPPQDMWIKIDPRQQVIHLLPAGAKKTACGIPYTFGTFLPIGKTRECQECKSFQRCKN